MAYGPRKDPFRENLFDVGKKSSGSALALVRYGT